MVAWMLELNSDSEFGSSGDAVQTSVAFSAILSAVLLSGLTTGLGSEAVAAIGCYRRR